MGNCFDKLTAEIAPSDVIKGSPVVRLCGSPTSTVTCYVRFGLLYKPVSVHFVPAEEPDHGSGDPVIRFGSETVSGPPERLIRYIDSKFPDPPLLNGVPGDEKTPLAVRVARLQHRSMTWHVERLVRWAEDLAARGGGAAAVDPAVGSLRMEVKKFGRSYGQLLEVMLEHAQMEERVVFPLLESADPGLCKAANEYHARDLPIMNGIKEDIKSIGVLDTGTPSYQEALFNLHNRLKTLQQYCKEHFDEEERKLLPCVEAVEVSREQHGRVFERCLEVMEGTHSGLFPFLIEGLLPREAMQYLDLIITQCSNKERVASMLRAVTK
ncbi:uncharacterized protein LOC131166814 [Malania oleifera]|uniref:uncharacterized protein LOC131166814 n=1 Tax=Malania oleifera TaxID=397392 RepID=UPI0025ADA618|nr:uncharacterized protein LOC131166814 [Malania oleifera]